MFDNPLPARWSESKILDEPNSVLRITTHLAGSTASQAARWLFISCLAPTSLQAAETIYETMEHAKTLFPPDMDYKIVYDTTPAVEASIHEILKTFVEALILVTIVVFVFLQNIRATIIPLLTIPISLVGTFIFFPILGFSINTLSMFGLVLAIGIVVDDAIVVVEAVIHHLEHGLPPKEATIKAMSEVSAPVIGIALILSAVFIPVALLGGLVGNMYKQFALTIAISVLLSAFNALSLTPALCALLLKEPKPMRGPLGVFFRGFNKVFDVTTNGYVHVSRLLVRRGIVTIAIVGVVVLGAGFFAKAIPTGFIPDEDQGILGVNVQLPPGSLSCAHQRSTEESGRDSQQKLKGSSRTRRSAAMELLPIPTSQTTVPFSRV